MNRNDRVLAGNILYRAHFLFSHKYILKNKTEDTAQLRHYTYKNRTEGIVYPGDILLN